MRPVTFARRIPGAPMYLPAEQRPEPTDHMVACQLTTPRLPSTPERELISAIILNALHALDLPPSRTAKLRRSQENAYRLNAIAWIMGFTRAPRFSFEFCCDMLGDNSGAARKALVAQHGISEEEIQEARSPWTWGIFAS